MKKFSIFIVLLLGSSLLMVPFIGVGYTLLIIFCCLIVGLIVVLRSKKISIGKLLIGYPWLGLLVLNLIFAGGLWLAFVLLFIAAGSEGYHPDSVSISRVPLGLTLFGVALVFFIGSLITWIWWRKVTPKRFAKIIFSYLLILVAAGYTAFSLTPANPDFRTYEYAGDTYVIPREYSPNMFWKGRVLSIYTCEEDVTRGKYAKPNDGVFTFSRYPCDEITASLTPADIVQLPSTTDLRQNLFSGSYGFTFATSTTGLSVLPAIDQALLEQNNIQVEQVNGQQIITLTTTVRSDHQLALYTNATNGQLEWLSVCGTSSCFHHYPLPDNPNYLLTVHMWDMPYNPFEESAVLNKEKIQEFQQQSLDIMEMFNSFKID